MTKSHAKPKSVKLHYVVMKMSLDILLEYRNRQTKLSIEYRPTPLCRPTTDQIVPHLLFSRNERTQLVILVIIVQITVVVLILLSFYSNYRRCCRISLS